MPDSEYQRGYDSALANIYAAVDSDAHPCNDTSCRACGTIRTVIEGTLLDLASLMTEEEFTAKAEVISRMGIRLWGK